MKTQRLGRGLDALIDSHDMMDQIKEVSLHRIKPNPYQPRMDFNEESLEELSQSIKEFGLIQPITVRKIEEGEGFFYQIAVGERRWRAAMKAQLKSIPAIVSEMDDQKMIELAMVENLQREDLNPIEEARAYQNMMDTFALTQETLSQRIGKSRSAVANLLRLLKLSPLVQEYVSRETISKGHARALLGLKDLEQQDSLLKRIVREDLSVRRTEEIIKRFNDLPLQKEDQVHQFLKYEKELYIFFETKVQIVEGKKRKKIVIEFQEEEDLKNILSKIRSSSM